jgi:hypothetical protein
LFGTLAHALMPFRPSEIFIQFDHGNIMNEALGLLSPRKIEESNLMREIQGLMARLHPETAVERRHDERVAIPLTLRLTPLDRDRRPVADDAITVVGKDISRRGLSFTHELPLTYRRAIISLDDPKYGRFAAEIDVTWCRFTKPGWYESGGRLVRSANPMDQPAAERIEAATWKCRTSPVPAACC